MRGFGKRIASDVTTAIILLYLSQGSAAAQEKGGFFDKIKGTFSSEIKIGTHTFKDGSVYTGEMKGRKPNGKGKTVFKNGDVFLHRNTTLIPLSEISTNFIFYILELHTFMIVSLARYAIFHL